MAGSTAFSPKTVPASRLRRTVMAGSGTLLGSAAGALLPFLVARWFEVGRETDVYFLAVGAVQLVGYVLAVVVESAVLPFAAKAQQQDRYALRTFCRRTSRYVLVAAVGVTVLSLTAIAFVLLPAAGIEGADRRTAMVYLAAVSALPVLAALSGVASAANFALDRFAFTTSTQVFRAGGGIAMALLLGDRWGLLAVALGLTLGELLRAVTLGLALPKAPDRLRRRPADVGMQVLRLASPNLVASVVIGVNPIVDKAVAARIEPGAATVVELGDKLFYIPMVLLVAAITKVSATVWARHVDVDDHALSRDFWHMQRAGIAVAGAVVLVMLPGILLFRGAAADFLGLSRDSAFFPLVIVLLIGLPVALSADLANAMLITLRRTGSFPAVTVVLVLVNLGADLVGAHLFGVVGIAVSTTLVRVINAAVFLWLCSHHLQRRIRSGAAADAPATTAGPAR